MYPLEAVFQVGSSSACCCKYSRGWYGLCECFPVCRLSHSFIASSRLITGVKCRPIPDESVPIFAILAIAGGTMSVPGRGRLCCCVADGCCWPVYAYGFDDGMEYCPTPGPLGAEPIGVWCGNRVC